MPYFGPITGDRDKLLAALAKRPIRLGGLVLASILISFCLNNTGCYFNASASSVTGSTPWFSQYFSQGAPGFKQLIYDLGTRLFAVGYQYNPPLWSIKAELYGSIFTYVFLLLFRTSNLRFLAYAIAMVLFHDRLYQGFIFGILFADVAKTFPNYMARLTRPQCSIPLLIIGFVCASYPHYVQPDHLVNTVYSVFPRIEFLGGGYSMLGAIFVFVATLLNPRLQEFLSGSVFAYLGRISFAAYAIHFLILCSLTSWVFLQLTPVLGYDLTCIIGAVAYILLTLICAHWLTVYIDEPTTKLANSVAQMFQRRIKEMRRQPAVT